MDTETDPQNFFSIQVTQNPLMWGVIKDGGAKYHVAKKGTMLEIASPEGKAAKKKQGFQIPSHSTRSKRDASLGGRQADVVSRNCIHQDIA